MIDGEIVFAAGGLGVSQAQVQVRRLTMVTMRKVGVFGGMEGQRSEPYTESGYRDQSSRRCSCSA